MAAIERTKAFIKAALPDVESIYRRIGVVRHALQVRSPVNIFSEIYRNNLWADPESVSGWGSTLARTEVIRGELPAVLESIRCRSLLDASCGDFNWMRDVDLKGIEYTGVDVVPELIARNRQTTEGQDMTFVVADITRDCLPKVDVILCRDCFIHLSFRDIKAALANFKRSDSRFLLATTHDAVAVNEDTRTGDWRSLNLQLPPFNFPQPLQLIIEDAELGKCLGLWSLQELDHLTSE